MNEQTLLSLAREVLRKNDAGDFTKPSAHQYPHQWNWDSALIALGLAHFDLPRARAEIRSLLRAQWRDGMVPHIIYHNGGSDYFPPPEFWQTRDLPHAGAIPSSSLTQPPLLATIVRALSDRWQVANDKGQETGNKEQDTQSAIRHPALNAVEGTLHAFIKQVYPHLLLWHRWLHTARTADGTGLPCLIHPWESGTDNSPRWTDALDRITPTDVPPFYRRDMIHVAPAERPLAADYERYVHLIDVGRRARWDARALLERSPFLVQDVLFCAILHRADDDLRALAIGLGEDTREIDDWLARTRQNFDARFWDAERGLYFDYDARAGAPIRVNTFATFAPLYAGLASQDQAARLIAEHWDNPAEYAPGADSRLRLPTTAKNERGYAPRRYWCGPVWMIANWIVYEGLRRYGYDAQADALRRDSLALIEASGFREYYDPRDGAGCGSTDFSWSAALTLEFASHNG